MENKRFNLAGGRHYGQDLVPKPLIAGEKYLVMNK